MGSDVHDLAPGDRVASNGGHAELVCVPRNLCVRIPDKVGFEEASFTVLGSIALQGIRLAQPTIGESMMVFGLGLLGLLSCQILAAQGCRVLAVDLNPRRLKLAESFGAKPVNAATSDPVQAALEFTAGTGVDGVIITAAAKNDQIVHQAATASRKRGRIILVGVVDLDLRREDFYEKELSFQVSCSYGPGRYDPAYEQAGRDYPLPYVRWTEQRNFQAVLNLIAEGKMSPLPLLSERIPFERAREAYAKIGADSESLGLVLTYPGRTDSSPTIRLAPEPPASNGPISKGVGVIGAGNFAQAILLPALAGTGAELRIVADLDPKAAGYAARKFGFGQATTDYREILNDPRIGTVLILAGHSVHARLVMESLSAGKQTFVEKPLAMNQEELDAISSLRNHLIEEGKEPRLMVGFNRRFSPHILRIRELLEGRQGPLCMNFTVNAGYIPAGHWTQDPVKGGGRIIGEACHFIDLLAHLAGAPAQTVAAFQVGEGPETREDKTVIILYFSDGSIATINYFSNGSSAFPKENLEIFFDGKTIRMENFRKTKGWGLRNFRSLKTKRQNKGHRAELNELLNSPARKKSPLIPFPELYNSTLASFLAVKAAREKAILEIPQTN